MRNEVEEAGSTSVSGGSWNVTGLNRIEVSHRSIVHEPHRERLAVLRGSGMSIRPISPWSIRNTSNVSASIQTRPRMPPSSAKLMQSSLSLTSVDLTDGLSTMR